MRTAFLLVEAAEAASFTPDVSGRGSCRCGFGIAASAANPKKKDTTMVVSFFLDVLVTRDVAQSGLLAVAANAAYKRFTAGKTLAQGRFTRPEHFDPLGVDPPKAAEPKRNGQKRCNLF